MDTMQQSHSRNGFRGAIDDFALYNRGLTGTEVYQLYSDVPRIGRCLPSGNAAPIVDAGQNVRLGDTSQTLQLNGSVLDDSLEVSQEWSLVKGLGNVQFNDNTVLNPEVTFDAPGLYVLQLEAADPFKSSSDVVEVRVGEVCEHMIDRSALSWLSANHHAKDLVRSETSAWRQTPRYTEGKVGTAFDFLGEGNYVETSGLDLRSQGEVSFEGWFYVEEGADQATNILTVRDAENDTLWLSFRLVNHLNSGFASYSLYRSDRQNSSTGGGILGHLTADFSGWVHFALTINESTGVVTAYLNGAEYSSAQLPVGVGVPERIDYYLGAEPSEGGDRTYVGRIDEFTVYGAVLDADEIAAIVEVGEAGKCAHSENEAPVVLAGDDITLHAVAELANLNGSVTDDLGYEGVRWIQLSGPGIATFSNSTQLNTSVGFDTEGTYLLALEAYDTEHRSRDTLVVSVGSNCEISLPQGALHWWRGERDSEDSLRGGDLTWRSEANYVEGVVGNAFSFEGISRGLVGADTIDYSALEEITVEFWLNTGATEISTPVITLSDAETGATQMSITSQSSRIAFRMADSSRTLNTTSIPAGDWVHLAYTADFVSKEYKVYLGGLEVARGVNTSIISNLSAKTLLHLGGSLNINSYFEGAIHITRQKSFDLHK